MTAATKFLAAAIKELRALGYTVAAPVAAKAAPAPSTVTWKSGASGDGVVDGSFGTWRGRPVDIAGTWADQQDRNSGWVPMLDPLDILPGGRFATWQADLDIAIGAINLNQDPSGAQKYGAIETWADAAAGAYDARWQQALTTLAKAWGTRAGTLYLRFAHEFNGDWYAWKVTPGEEADFVTAWKRFRALQQQIFPAARLVFCPSAQTNTGIDWRKCFPGKAYVDVLGVDYYNEWPCVLTADGFATQSVKADSTGAPWGIESHRQFAEQQGLPFGVCEWSSNAGQADAPGFMDAFYAWMRAHAGKGPGQVLYEIVFNVSSFNDNPFALHPTTNQPNAAAEYPKALAHS